MRNDLMALAAKADRCVSCGLCVPLCPTWQASRNEANSPRGRIMIMAQLAQRRQPAGAAGYLDACLGCGRCEQACPNDVPYMDMLPTAKAIAPGRPALPARLVARLSRSHRGQALFGLALAGARLLHATGLAGLLPRRWRPFARTAPARGRGALRTPTAPAGARPVWLFPGCLGRHLDRTALHAAIDLLAATGHAPRLPGRHLCCGAIARHAGDLATATRQEQECQAALAGDLPVATTATGCAERLAATLGDRVVDAGALVAGQAAGLAFTPSPRAQVLVHEPCTQRRVAGQGAWVRQLLGLVPGLQVVDAPGNGTCCGAGGLTALSHPTTGHWLATAQDQAWQARLAAGAAVVTTNHGCGWHLAAHASGPGRLPVSHPLTFVRDLAALPTDVR